MIEMKKHGSSFLFALITFSVVFLILTPYLTSDFLEIRQQEEERLARENAYKLERKTYLTGKFDPKDRDDFILIAPQYALGENKMYLRKETYDAYLKMQEVAKKDGVNLFIASATRNFNYQRDLWNKKWNGKTLVEGKDLSQSIEDGQERFEKILEYSAAPATSRHHWGTDIDINGATPEYFKTERGMEVYAWLSTNAPLFGFCQPYNLKGTNRKTGYNEEKWHWSYLPLARTFTEEFKKFVTDEDITGFNGDEYVKDLDLLNNYVLSINPECL